MTALESGERTVYVVAFRHKVPGEGVGGHEWDFRPGEAERRVAELLAGDADYETYRFSFTVGADVGKDAITDEADARAWTDWRADGLVEGGRSHWIEFPTDRRSSVAVPFEREEVFPVVRVTVPRAGTVQAKFSCDRYVASVYDERDGSSERRMGDWRIVLREVREDTDETFPAEAQGIGPVTRKAIRDAGEPIVREWLGSQAYRSSRRKAAAFAFRREVRDETSRTGASGVERCRERLEAIGGELAPVELSHLKQALETLSVALEAFDREPVG